MPKVRFGPDGFPTEASYKALSQAAARIEGVQSGEVDLAYFKTSAAETAALDAWMSAMQEASDRGNAPRYVGVGQNCLTFCLAGLFNANVRRAALVNTVDPRIAIKELQWLSDSSFDYPVKGKSSHKIDPACVLGTPGCSPDTR